MAEGTFLQRFRLLHGYIPDRENRRSRSPPRRVQERLDQPFEPVNLKLYRVQGSCELSFEIQIVTEGSRDELCFLRGLTSWTVRDLKSAICRTAMRELHLLYQDHVLDDDQKLIDLDCINEKLIVSLRHQVKDLRHVQQLPANLKFYRARGPDQFFFDIQVVGATSGDEFCLLRGLPWWTVRTLKTAIATTSDSDTRATRLRLIVGDKVLLEDSQKLIDLDIMGEKLIVHFIRLPGPDAEQVNKCRKWLEGLDDGVGMMLPYLEALVNEFDADFHEIAGFKVDGGGRRGILSVVLPSFWDIVGVTKTGHKMLFARGIAKLPAGIS